MNRPRIGISSCLLGAEVRHDGGHRRDAWVSSRLADFVELVPVCPEVESGMPVPRESLRLVGEVARPRLVAPRSGTDHTATLSDWSWLKVEGLARQHLDGFLLEKGSPSCGLERVRVYPEHEGRPPRHEGRGVFAGILAERLPHLPLCERGWLNDDGLRESFLVRVFTHHRLREQVLEREGGPTLAALIDFHGAHKFLYLAHSPAHYRSLGRLVGSAGERPLEETLARYRLGAMEALALRPTAGKQVNVLEHILGYFKDQLDADEKRELLELITDYRAGLRRREVPMALLGHHLRRLTAAAGGTQAGLPWLARQVYFQPFPLELAGAR
ncbi:MAG: DUF523 and DUF1722 domain-containing protein [Deltaproteobacteria bacterium]|nr:DUF523 and DUF1722 domain-containing protein [Deltaproteobacteria bacterium]